MLGKDTDLKGMRAVLAEMATKVARYWVAYYRSGNTDDYNTAHLVSRNWVAYAAQVERRQREAA